jgi:hypothetical protein
MATVRQVARCGLFIFIASLPIIAAAQVPGPNINMVSGTGWPGGDPYLQRQDEPSMAVSTRSPMHILAGANDYRTVDLPGLPDGEETGDAWLGLFKSLDGGMTWSSTLIAGYPQDTSAEGLAAPIRQMVNGITFPAGADPMVRSGLFGMFYYSGIALTRTNPPVSAVFVSRFNDFNNREGSDPIHSLGMTIVADGRPGHKFYDKPTLAVDLPRPGGASLCSLGGQFLPAGNVYVVYTDIETSGSTTTAAKLRFSRSADCGSTWSNPILISGTNTLNQGSVMTIDTLSGALYVVWRRIARNAETNAILVTKSVDGGKNFSTPVVISSITPFEQGTTGTSFRTPAYPTATTDANGRLYVAWSERTGPSGSILNISDKADGRIMLSSTANAVAWSTPVMVAPTTPISALSGRGHQFMPALSYASGKLMLAYYDLREDSTVGHYSPSPLFTETRFLLGNLASPLNLDNVFNNFVQDASVTGPLLRRHTLDIRASQAAPGVMPVFEASQRVSRYKFGSTPSDLTIRQLEFNPPNLKMFKQGTVPFIGDYIDLVPQYPFFSSLINLPIPAPVFYAAWTDNRDVRPPKDGNWANYTPVAVFGGPSKIDPTQPAPVCVPGQTGMRNQNIYTSRITAGLYFASPGNEKPLGRIQRAFVVTVQNTRTTTQSYRLQILNQPPGGKASFQQLPANAPAVVSLDVTVNAKSSASRTVFVTSFWKNAPVVVTVAEITAAGGGVTPNGLTSVAVLNPDPSSPDIGSSTPGTPDIGSTEVYSPDIGSPDIGTPGIPNPDIGTPDIGSPDIGTPDIGSPDIGTPDIGTPELAEPDIGSPDIGTPDIGSGSLTDTTWPLADDGNTTASYTVKLLQTGSIPPGIKLQMILHQTYKTPVARDCVLATESHHILLNNVPHPTVLTSTDGIGSPDIGTPSIPTVAIAAGDSVNLTIRVVDPVHKNRVIDASTFLTPVIVAHAINTADLNNPNPQPPISMVITTNSLPDGVRTVTYPTTRMTALFGIGALTWSVVLPVEGPALPPGLTIDAPTGVISGTPTQIGTYRFTITVHDSATPRQHFTSRAYTIRISNPLTFTMEGVPSATQGSAYSQTLTSSGGLAPIHWTLFSGSLPVGLTLSDGGTITGTPTTVATSSFQVQLTDSSQPAQTLTSPTMRLDVMAPPTGCGPTVSLLFDNWNIQGVSNGGTPPNFSTGAQVYCLDSISDYHWNNGAGSTPGTIGLLGPNQQLLGPWQAVGSSGQGGAPNVNWTAGPPAGSAVLLSGTYSVNDSNTSTWSQNAQSKGVGFARVFVRSYTQTYTVQGRLTYNGAPRTPTTAPQFFLRNEDTGQQQNANISWGGADTFTISGLPAGNFGVEVTSAEGSPNGVFFPGGFYSFTTFNSVIASDGGFTVNLTRLIHLTLPFDNASAFTEPFGCPPTLSATAPGQVSWDAIDVASTYSYNIDRVACPYTVVQSAVRSGSTTGTSVTFDPLPTTATGEYYVLTLYANSGQQIFVGQIMTNGTNWHGWDLRFVVP